MFTSILPITQNNTRAILSSSFKYTGIKPLFSIAFTDADLNRGHFVVVLTAWRQLADKRSSLIWLGPAPVSITVMITVVIDPYNRALQLILSLRF